jgi:hypothetical protein
MTYPVMTLPELRTATRQRADMVNSQFITDSEFNSYINASYFELYDLLVQKYGNDYYMKEYSFSLQGNVSRYDLPQDFFKLLGVDLSIGGGPDGYVSLRPFTLAERNRYSTANVQTWIGVTNLRYRLSANKLWFTPSPQTGQEIRIWYVPRLEALIDPVTVTLAVDPVADDYLSIDTTTFVAGVDFTITGNPVATAVDLAAVINASPAMVALDVVATSSGATVTIEKASVGSVNLTVGNQASPVATPGATTRMQLSSATLSNGTETADGVSGWLEYVVTDAAIKALQKEESDTTVLQIQKAALIKRIEAAAENRDAGSPATVADVQWTNGTWPFGNGFGGGGGIP